MWEQKSGGAADGAPSGPELGASARRADVSGWLNSAQGLGEGAPARGSAEEALANTPALWSEVLHSCVGLVGGEDGHLLAIGPFGRGDDLILCGEDGSVRTAHRGTRGRGQRRSSLPVVSLSGFSQSRMTKEGHPSTVTTVRLEGGVRGGEVTFTSPGSSSGK